jgi:hypothetical protein
MLLHAILQPIAQARASRHTRPDAQDCSMFSVHLHARIVFPAPTVMCTHTDKAVGSLLWEAQGQLLAFLIHAYPTMDNRKHADSAGPY